MYQHVGKTAYRKDLTNIVQLLDHLSDPQRKFRSVHVAGTNGKGTCAHFLAAIMQSAGYKVGLYTSPHLKKFTERIKINGREIEKHQVVSFVERTQTVMRSVKPSFFELTVAMSFDHFALQNVDIAIIETGLGGRLDSTNVITPLVSLITNIGFDHTDILGNTLEKIAKEKAGIIKKNVPVVIGTYQEETMGVFGSMALKKGSELILSGSPAEMPDLPSHFPCYFKKNLPGVLAVTDVLKRTFTIDKASIENGIKNMTQLTGLKGRFQILDTDPMIIADISHNRNGIQILMQQIARMKKKELRIIFGMVKDKNPEDILNVLPKNAFYYWTKANGPRNLDPDILKREADRSGLNGKICTEVGSALTEARQASCMEDIILITGSTFVVAGIPGL